MEDKKPASLQKRILFALITFGFFFFLIESILSIYFYQRRGSSKLATIEFLRNVRQSLRPKLTPYNVGNQKLVRPDSSDAMNELVTKETAISNRYEYEAWVEFKNADFKGKYMNIEKGVRRSIPESFFNPQAKDTLLVYFFGGSTVFGFNVADFETIPSYFAGIYKEQYPNAKSIKVVNFGCPNYYSYQELILFSKLIFQGHKPDIAIFFDGLNDFWFGKMTYSNESFYSFYFRKTFFADQPLSTNDLWFTDSLQNLFKTPKGIPEKEFSDSLIKNYFSSINNIKRVAKITGTKTYFFCQPVPFYNYPNHSSDPVVFRDTLTRFSYIYPIVEKKGDSVENFVFMGNMLQNETGYPFVDGFHYAPRIHKKIAKEILTVIGKDLH